MIRETTSTKNRTFVCSPTLVWVKDVNQTLLIDPNKELFLTLKGVEAATWDWLTLAYPYEKTLHFLALLSGGSPESAAEQLHAILCAWRQAGIIQNAEKEGQCDQSDH